MNIDLLVSILTVLLSSASGVLVAPLQKVVERLFATHAPKKTYLERLSEMTNTLVKASSEVDAVLLEMVQVARERESYVRQLEAGLLNLEKKEKELKDNIAVLQNVPIAAAEYFAKLVEPVEKRSARRDYLLFIGGVVVTTVIAIVLRKAFGI